MTGLFLSIGAGPGIGFSTARRFATEGFRVVLAARTVARLEVLAKGLRRESNAGVEIASVDCSDSLQVADLVGRKGSLVADIARLKQQMGETRMQMAATRDTRVSKLL